MPDSADTERRVRCDVAVVGGGPAGLAAAAHLGRAGAQVVVLEEASSLGGQYFKRRLGAVLAEHGDYRPEGTRLITAAQQAGARCLTGQLVWGVDDDGRTLLTASDTGPALEVSARACLVATGAYERAIPFPGWQLPGVVTPGHALHLATCDHVPLGQRVVIAGTGPFLLVAACSVLRAGGRVIAVVEMNRPYRLGVRALSSLQFPARLKELSGYVATLARHRVPILQGRRVLAAEGDGRVTAVVIGDRGAVCSPSVPPPGTRRLSVDAVAVGFGFRPATELLRLFGVRVVQDELGDVFPQLDGFGRTTVPGVYAAGEVSQIAGVRAALLGGRLAATAIAADLHLPCPPDKTQRVLAARLASERRFAALTSRLYSVTLDDYLTMPDETMVCRCEGVSAKQLRQAAAGSPDPSAVKSLTRAGMGPCQGRQCGTAAMALVSARRPGPDAPPPFAARMPVKPVAISAVLEAEPRGC